MVEGKEEGKENVLKMQVKCLKCADVKELSSEEIQELGKYINDKKLKGEDYLGKINLDVGYTCKNDEKHKYTFVEAFDDALHEKAEIIEKDVVEIQRAETSVANLDGQIKAMIKQKEEEEKKAVETKEGLVVKKEILVKMTGSDNHKLWVRQKEKSTVNMQ